MRSGLSRLQRRDVHLRMPYTVEPLLLGSAVERMRRHAEAEILIKFDTGSAIGNTDRSMVNAKKKITPAARLPIWRDPIVWKCK